MKKSYSTTGITIPITNNILKHDIDKDSISPKKQLNNQNTVNPPFMEMRKPQVLRGDTQQYQAAVNE